MFNSESAGGVKVQMCLFCGDKRTQKNAVFKETNYNLMVSWLSSMLRGGQMYTVDISLYMAL